MDITSSGVRGRKAVGRLAPIDAKAALKFAAGITHPWYRCQSLATAAEHLSGKDRLWAIDKALAAAKELSEPNRIVTVSSWPIRVLAKVDPGMAADALVEQVSIAGTEPHNLRRAHALQALAFATAPNPDLLELVIPALADALLGGTWATHRPRDPRHVQPSPHHASSPAQTAGAPPQGQPAAANIVRFAYRR